MVFMKLVPDRPRIGPPSRRPPLRGGHAQGALPDLHEAHSGEPVPVPRQVALEDIQHQLALLLSGKIQFDYVQLQVG